MPSTASATPTQIKCPLVSERYIYPILFEKLEALQLVQLQSSKVGTHLSCQCFAKFVHQWFCFVSPCYPRVNLSLSTCPMLDRASHSLHVQVIISGGVFGRNQGIWIFQIFERKSCQPLLFFRVSTKTTVASSFG